jgi:hypothetical protein
MYSLAHENLVRIANQDHKMIPLERRDLVP